MFSVGTMYLEVFHFTGLLRHQHVREGSTVTIWTVFAGFQALVKTVFTELLLTTVDQMGLNQDLHTDGADQILWNRFEKLHRIRVTEVFGAGHL